MPDSLLLTEHLGTMLHHLAIAPPLHTQPLARRLMQSDSSSAEGEGASESGPLQQQQQQQDAQVQGQPPEAQMRAGFGAKLLASSAASVLGGMLPSEWDYKIVGGKTAPPARFKVRALAVKGVILQRQGRRLPLRCLSIHLRLMLVHPFWPRPAPTANQPAYDSVATPHPFP
jgi:hypothetical protein